MPGGLWSPNPGDPILSSSAIDFWSKQVVILCTSGTRPSSPRTGMHIFETDTYRHLVYGSAAWVTVTPVSAKVATSESTSSTSYTDLATSGPSVSSVQLGASVLVSIGAMVRTAGASHQGFVSFAVSGATTLASADAQSSEATISSTSHIYVFRRVPYTSLTAGANTFKEQYRSNSATSTSFENRDITVEGVPV